MIPIVAGMLSSASQITNVILAGGTQMGAVLAFGHATGFNEKNIAIGTTSYIVDDKTANFLDVIKKIADIPILVATPKLENSQIKGLKSFSEGFVKEGAGAGGCMISAMLKIGIKSEELLSLIEKEYQRVLTSQSQT
jgi:NaMN:DMB phosphoribosyltransferase